MIEAKTVALVILSVMGTLLAWTLLLRLFVGHWVWQSPWKKG